MIQLSLVSTLLSPNCSRYSGFKSSLNEVHLRIYHVLEATSYLSDTATMHVLGRDRKPFRQILRPRACRGPALPGVGQAEQRLASGLLLPSAANMRGLRSVRYYSHVSVVSACRMNNLKPMGAH